MGWGEGALDATVFYVRATEIGEGVLAASVPSGVSWIQEIGQFLAGISRLFRTYFL